MTTLKRPASHALAAGLTLALVTAAAAQRFVWPPAAGDQMAQAAEDPSGGDQPRDDRPQHNGQPANTEAYWANPSATAAPEPLINLAARPAVAAPGQPLPAVSVPAGGGLAQWKILENPNGPHTAMIFDPVRQVFAVYHVDSASGQIMLKSVRNLSADLQLPQFNSSNPAPKEIQGMLNEAR